MAEEPTAIIPLHRLSSPLSLSPATEEADEDAVAAVIRLPAFLPLRAFVPQSPARSAADLPFVRSFGSMPTVQLSPIHSTIHNY